MEPRLRRVGIGLCAAWLAGGAAWAQEPAAAPETVVDGAPGEAEPPAPVPSPELVEAQTLTRAIEALLNGQLPADRSVDELFTVDLRDPEAVSARVAALRALLGAPEPAGDADAELARARRALAGARLRFLTAPTELREGLLEADAERLRIARDHSAANDAVARGDAAEAAARDAEARALEEARAAASDLERRLAGERARLARVEGELAAFEAAQAARHQALLAEDESALEALFALRRVVAEGSGNDADAVFRQVVAAWSEAAATLSARLDDAQPPVAPRYAVDPQIADALVGGDASLAAPFRAAESEIGARAARVDRDVSAWHHAALDAVAQRESALFALRSEALSRLPAAERAAVRGVSSAGLASARDEVRHASLRLRWERAAAARWFAQPRAARVSVDSGIAGAKGLVSLLPVLLAWWLGRSRVVGWSAAAVEWLASQPGRARLAVPLGRWSSLSAPTLVPVLDLAAAWGASRVLGEAPYVGAVVVFMVLVAAYRWVVVATVAFLPPLVSTPALAPVLAGGLEAALRLVGRYWLVTVVLVDVATWRLGDGTLAEATRRACGLGWLAVFAVLAHRWREPVLDAYLAARPDGSLASTVEGARGRWYAVFVGLAAFAVVAGAGAAAALRRFAMGFDQTRRVLAYLFRRKLEQDAGKLSAEQLPASEQAALLAAPEPGGRWWVERGRWAGVVDLALAGWRAGEAPSVVVVGGRGAGKTTWLESARRATGAAQVLRPPRRLVTSPDALAWLGSALGAPTGSTDELVAGLLGGPPRVVLVDDAHLLVLRGVEVGGAWDSFAAVVARSAPRVLWIATVDREAWEWQRWRRRNQVSPFTTVLSLGEWTEAEVEQLLLARVAGRTITFDSLVVGGIEGVSASAGVVGTQADFVRLVWDYADGIPAVALRAWVDSLGPGPGGAWAVHLFPRVDGDRLEALGETEKMVLACVAWHGAISAADVARSLRLAARDCNDALAALQRHGVLVVDEERYAVTTPWIAAVQRYLRRKHLLESE